MNKKIYYKGGVEHRFVELDKSIEQEDDGSLLDLLKWILGRE